MAWRIFMPQMEMSPNSSRWPKLFWPIGRTTNRCAPLALGPKLPPALYSLFDLYEAHGDMEKRQEISSLILQYWPNDEQVRM